MANRNAIFETNKGNFKIELFEDKVPITTGNFIKLTNDGFYDGLIFHRVIQGFMIQGGCPEGMDIVMTISKVQKGRNDKPLEDIIINKITIE